MALNLSTLDRIPKNDLQSASVNPDRKIKPVALRAASAYLIRHPMHRLAKTAEYRAEQLKYPIVTAACALLCVSNVPATAQVREKVDVIREGQKVEVTATQLSNINGSIDAPTAKTVVNHAELSRFGDTNFADALKKIPGVSLDNGIVRLQGLGNGYVNILIDGEPVSRTFSFDTLSLDLVERVEISTNPIASQRSGAIGGVVNIILRKASRTNRSDLKLIAKNDGESWQPNISVSRSFSAQDVKVQMLSAYNQDDGRFYELSEIADMNDGSPYQARSNLNFGDYLRKVLQVAPSLEWRLDNRSSLELQAMLHFVRRNVREDNVVQNSDPNSDLTESEKLTNFWRNQEKVSGSWTWKGGQRRFEARYSIDRNSRRTTDSYVLRQAAHEELDRFAEGFAVSDLIHSARIAYSIWFADESSLVIGSDADRNLHNESHQHFDANAEYLPATFKSTIDRHAWFIEATWRQGKNDSLYLGIRQDRVSLGTMDSSNHELSNSPTFTSPSIQQVCKIGPNGNTQLRLIVNKLFQSPKPEYLIDYINKGYIDNSPTSPDIQGNPNLRPERSIAANLILEHQFAQDNVVSVSLSRRRIADFVVKELQLLNNRWVETRENGPDAKVFGAEFSAKLKLDKNWFLGIPIGMRINLARYWSSVKADNFSTGHIEGQVPKEGSIGIDAKIPSLPLTIGGNYSVSGGYRFNRGQNEEVSMARTRSADLYGKYSIDSRSVIRLSVGNLFKPDSFTRIHVNGMGAQEIRATTERNYKKILLAFERTM